jgi:hypothetical protein
MTDPGKVNKGGFGAFAALDREQQATRAASELATTAASTTPLSAASAGSPQPGPHPRPSPAENAAEAVRGPASGG